jgi:hypothetical protein
MRWPPRTCVGLRGHALAAEDMHWPPRTCAGRRGHALDRPTHVLGCQCPALKHQRAQAVQSFDLLSSPAAALWHPQLRKTFLKRTFPRPRVHMHAHEASERADTHTCHTRWYSAFFKDGHESGPSSKKSMLTTHFSLESQSYRSASAPSEA